MMEICTLINERDQELVKASDKGKRNEVKKFEVPINTNSKKSL